MFPPLAMITQHLGVRINLMKYQGYLYLSICWTLGWIWLNELDLRMTSVREESNECRP